MKKIIINLIALITVSPMLFLNNSVLAQERNFKSSCGYQGTSGVEHNYGERGKCFVKTYVKGDYLIVEVKSSWEEGKRMMKLENKPYCNEWNDLSFNPDANHGTNVCDGQYWYGDNTGWSYIVAYADNLGFGYSLGNAYRFTYDGPLLRPSNSATKNPNQKQANSNSDNACMSTIKQTANQIHDYGASVNVLAYKGENNGQNGNPTNRDIHLSMLLGGSSSYNDSIISLFHGSNNTDKATANVLNSSQLQQTWANDIVKKCSDVAVVTFAQDQTDYSREYAIQTNGQTKERECIFPGDSAGNNSWNYTGCE